MLFCIPFQYALPNKYALRRDFGTIGIPLSPHESNNYCFSYSRISSFYQLRTSFIILLLFGHLPMVTVFFLFDIDCLLGNCNKDKQRPKDDY